MSRRHLIDFVCRNPDCDRILAREAEDGTWTVTIAQRDGHRWRTITEWNERFVCPDCKTEGYPDAFAAIFAARDRRRVRIPIRPPV